SSISPLISPFNFGSMISQRGWPFSSVPDGQNNAAPVQYASAISRAICWLSTVVPSAFCVKPTGYLTRHPLNELENAHNRRFDRAPCEPTFSIHGPQEASRLDLPKG